MYSNTTIIYMDNCSSYQEPRFDQMIWLRIYYRKIRFKFNLALNNNIEFVSFVIQSYNLCRSVVINKLNPSQTTIIACASQSMDKPTQGELTGLNIQPT